MDAQEFKKIQTELRLTDQVTADVLDVDIASVRNWLRGRTIKGPVALAMRMLQKHKDELQDWMFAGSRG